MQAQPQLRLPTISVALRVAVVGNTKLLATEVFLPDTPRSGRTALIDDVVSLFEGDGDFVPMRCEDGVVKLFGKGSLACVAMLRRVDRPQPAEVESSEVFTLYEHEHKVEVELLGGMKLEGMLMDSSPSSRSRAVDHLNRAGRFVRLWGAEEHFLVNKGQIVQVGELVWTPE
nr:hypothetical protein [Kofleriaceae bacterium]